MVADFIACTGYPRPTMWERPSIFTGEKLYSNSGFHPYFLTSPAPMSWSWNGKVDAAYHELFAVVAWEPARLKFQEP